MSTRHTNIFFGDSENPREVELIQNIVVKTKQGKIPWVKQANALTATIPGGFQVNFVLSSVTVFNLPTSWQLLTVRDTSGSELVRVSNVTSISAAMGAGKGALVEAADQLFMVVNSSTSNDSDRAINTIKNL